MKLIKSILALAATVFLGASAMAADQYVPISLAYADKDHAETAEVHNHYHKPNSGYTYVFSYAVPSGDSLVNVSQTQPAESTYDAYTTIEALADSGTAKVQVIRRNGRNDPKLDMGFDVTLAAKRVLYVGEKLTGVRCNYEISGNDTAVTGSTGNWSSSVEEGENSVTVTDVVDANNYRNDDLTVTGDAIGWAKVLVTFESTGMDDHEGITYTRWFQVRDTLQPQAFTNRQVLTGTELSTIGLADIVMVDSKGTVVEGSWQWVNASKTLSVRGAYVEQATFTASGDNAEFYDAATIDVTIDVGAPKTKTTGDFGASIAPSEGTRTLNVSELGWQWVTAKVVGDDLGGVTVTAAHETDDDAPVVNVKNATRGGKVTIWVENDDNICIYEGIVYQEKSEQVTGYKNSTMHLTLKADVAGVWTAHSGDETIATVTVPSESASEIEAAITCKDEGNTQLTIKNDYVVYTVVVNVDDEKPVEPGKFNLAQGEKVVMSLHYLNGQTPTARYFYVSNDVNDVVGFLVARDGSWQVEQKTLNVTFTATSDDGKAKTTILQHNTERYQETWDPYTSLSNIAEAVAMPKRIVYLGETKDLYCLSSEAAAWTVKTAEDGIVSVTAPSGAVAEGYAKVAGEKVGTTTFTIGNTAEAEEGFFKGVTYTINYEVRGMPMPDGGALTGDAYLKPGVELSTIGVAGSMKDAKGNKVEGTFAWVDGTQTFDDEGTESVDAIFTPANSSYDSVKVEVIITVKPPKVEHEGDPLTLKVGGKTTIEDPEWMAAWTAASDDEAIAKVTASGEMMTYPVVTAVAPGKTKVVVEDSKDRWTYEVTVLAANIKIKIVADEDEGNIGAVYYDGDDYANKDLELPAETEAVTLTLEADTSLNVPVYKVVTNGVDGVVTSVTTRVATYSIKNGDTLEFFAEEADETDSTVTDDDIKTALLESIDDPEPATCDAAAKKVNDVVGTGAKQVSARDLAAYINKNGVQSSEIAGCDYVAASVKLNTDKLIKGGEDANTEIEFVNDASVTADGFVFDVSIVIDGSDPLKLDEKMTNIVAACIQTTENLGTGFLGETVDPGRVEILDETKVLIKPAAEPKSAEFFKFVIPPDPKALPEVAKNVTDTTYVVSFSREDADVTAGQFTVRVEGDGTVKTSGTIDGLSYSGTSDLVINSYGGIEIPVVATDKKGDVIVFKIDAPAVEEADVVELNIANVSLSKGETLVPAEITIEPKDPTTDQAFIRVVIPADPGAK